MKQVLLAWMVLLALGGSAHAAGLIESTTSWRWPEGKAPTGLGLIRSIASPGEASYARALGTSLGTTASPAARVAQRFTTPDDLDRALSVRGIRVNLGDGTVVERLFFDSEQAAFDYVLYAADLRTTADTAAEKGKLPVTQHFDVIVEARGNQVLIIRGTGLENAALASRVLDAAWGSGLAPPQSPPTVSATVPDGGGVMVFRPRADEIFDREVRETYDEFHKSARQGREGVTEVGPTHYRFGMNGVVGEMRTRNGISTIVFGMSDELQRQLELQLERAAAVSGSKQKKTKSTPPLPPRKPAPGAAGRLKAIFD